MMKADHESIPHFSFLSQSLYHDQIFLLTSPSSAIRLFTCNNTFIHKLPGEKIFPFQHSVLWVMKPLLGYIYFFIYLLMYLFIYMKSLIRGEQEIRPMYNMNIASYFLVYSKGCIKKMLILVTQVSSGYPFGSKEEDGLQTFVFKI